MLSKGRKNARGAKSKLKKKKKVFRKKVCKVCVDKIDHIDYKEATRLQRFITEKGKIISRKINGNCNRHQRYVSNAVKRARQISLLFLTMDCLIP